MAGNALHGIAGIEDYWERRTMRSRRPAPSVMADRILLDLLGLGIEQALQHLGQTRPDFDAFAAWVVATAGPPDPDRVARYNAWVAGDPVPEATARELAAIDAMAPVLGADDLAQWDRLGYVVLRRAIEPDEAAAAEALLWRLLDARPDDPSGWYGPRTNGIMIQHFQDPVLEVARRSKRIHKAFAQLHGTGDLWASTDRMSFNPPEHAGYRFPGPHLHWDMSLASPRPLSTGGILYLTDTDANQGALQVVPGFHHRLDGWLAEIGDADPRTIDLSAEAVPIPARAGDLVIWRHELPHGASPNTATRPRMVQYVNRYGPEEIEQRVWL
ncbi:MAG: phytanoyl-CoA dioxygenase family protein [Methylorubrum rhodinum]|uniref:phytanoyl-CoA dioxygenase family protein n=1 Tax=Methylorubrum rhodinum TaxID=29428 RepID=UPI003BB1BB95